MLLIADNSVFQLIQGRRNLNRTGKNVDSQKSFFADVLEVLVSNSRRVRMESKPEVKNRGFTTSALPFFVIEL